MDFDPFDEEARFQVHCAAPAEALTIVDFDEFDEDAPFLVLHNTELHGPVQEIEAAAPEAEAAPDAAAAPRADSSDDDDDDDDEPDETEATTTLTWRLTSLEVTASPSETAAARAAKAAADIAALAAISFPALIGGASAAPQSRKAWAEPEVAEPEADDEPSLPPPTIRRPMPPRPRNQYEIAAEAAIFHVAHAKAAAARSAIHASGRVGPPPHAAPAPAPPTTSPPAGATAGAASAGGAAASGAAGVAAARGGGAKAASNSTLSLQSALLSRTVRRGSWCGVSATRERSSEADEAEAAPVGGAAAALDGDVEGASAALMSETAARFRSRLEAEKRGAAGSAAPPHPELAQGQRGPPLESVLSADDVVCELLGWVGLEDTWSCACVCAQWRRLLTKDSGAWQLLCRRVSVRDGAATRLRAPAAGGAEGGCGAEAGSAGAGGAGDGNAPGDAPEASAAAAAAGRGAAGGSGEGCWRQRGLALRQEAAELRRRWRTNTCEESALRPHSEHISALQLHRGLLITGSADVGQPREGGVEPWTGRGTPHPLLSRSRARVGTAHDQGGRAAARPSRGPPERRRRRRRRRRRWR